MFELSQTLSRIDLAWEQAALKARLPADASGYFDHAGLTPSRPNSQRVHRRFFLRSKAILVRGGERLGVYTSDASRSGIGFLSPLELLADEQVGIRLPSSKEFRIRIVRCRYVSECCYECGAVFVLGSG